MTHYPVSTTHRLAQLILSLGCPVLAVVSWSDWGGPWPAVLAFALGVGAVVLHVYERRLRKADELSTLNIPH